MTLAICLYNILYDEHFVGKYDVKEEQRSTVGLGVGVEGRSHSCCRARCR